MIVKVSFVKYTIQHQMKEEIMRMPNPDGCAPCIPNTVVMGQDHFLSFVYFKDNFTYFYVMCYKIYPSGSFNFTADQFQDL